MEARPAPPVPPSHLGVVGTALQRLMLLQLQLAQEGGDEETALEWEALLTQAMAEQPKEVMEKLRNGEILLTADKDKAKDKGRERSASSARRRRREEESGEERRQEAARLAAKKQPANHKKEDDGGRTPRADDSETESDEEMPDKTRNRRQMTVRELQRESATRFTLLENSSGSSPRPWGRS